MAAPKILPSAAAEKLTELLGSAGVRFLKHGLGAIGRILPHVEATGWRLEDGVENAAAIVDDKITADLVLGIMPHNEGGFRYSLCVSLRRKHDECLEVSELNAIEKRLCILILETISRTLRPATETVNAFSLRAIEGCFDEHIVAEELVKGCALNIDLSSVFAALRTLAEQSYENKSITCGCLIDADDDKRRLKGTAHFPLALTKKKKYRILADGYQTAYKLSSWGRMRGLIELQKRSKASGAEATHYPTWCEGLAEASKGHHYGISLTRQGDILFFSKGRLAYSYRNGRWQYWNHEEFFRTIQQRVHPGDMFAGGSLMYICDAALDVSFRRTGGLFVILNKPESVKEIVDEADRVGNEYRDDMDRDFDREFEKAKYVYNISRQVMVRLAGLDGAVVTGPNGHLLAYGAILRVPKAIVSGREEGSRTKAAIAASHYGIAVKISADGDIKCYDNGKEFLTY